MSLSDREHLRVPPDGAGKALSTGHILHIEYTGGTADDFVVGKILTGATSGAQATVLDALPKTATSGHLNTLLADSGINDAFQVGEDMLIDSVVVGQVSAFEDYHVSRTEVVGSNNPRFGQSVDVLGAASVRFTEGSPNFDSGGRTEVSDENWIGIYSQAYDENPTLIQTWTTGGGALNYDSPSSTSELQVNDTSGSSVVRQTHLYHHYRSGIPQSVWMTIAAGSNTTGCVRRWGYFDENDGLFFEYDGATMYVVMRSSASGSMVETRVAQDDWNGDQLDGSGNLHDNPSQLMLNVENFWLYGISFLYLGAGPVRFSAYAGDKRTTVHTFHNGGQSPLPFMRTGTLPLRWEIENTQATSSPTQLRQGNATVLSHGDWAPQEKVYGSSFRDPISVTGETAVAVIRAKQTLSTGQENRGTVFPNEMRIMTTTEPIFIMLTVGGDFNITDWYSEYPESMLEQGVNLSTPGDFGTAGPPPIIDKGRVTYSHLVVPGEVGYIDLSKTFSVRADGEIRRDADITQAKNHAVIMQSATGVTTDVTLAFTWREVR